MGKLAIVYWSGTGHTEEMANYVFQGATSAGGEAELYTADKFPVEELDNMSTVAFGCPSMGDEELEETEFRPMFDACRPKLKGKPIGLFGSFGWGNGEWMRKWEQECRDIGANLTHEGIICNEAPDEAAARACRRLGISLAR